MRVHLEGLFGLSAAQTQRSKCQQLLAFWWHYQDALSNS